MLLTASQESSVLYKLYISWQAGISWATDKLAFTQLPKSRPTNINPALVPNSLWKCGEDVATINPILPKP